MKISKPIKTDQLTFKDLQIGDVFSCQGSEELDAPHIMMKISMRMGFIIQAVSLESGTTYGHFKDHMPVRFFPEATVVLGNEAK